MLTPKVLLVNDDAAGLFALESLLTNTIESREYDVVTARSGEEALRQVLMHEFAVILLDVSMPGMDGFETAEAIHSHPRSASVPIIFITAHYADEINRMKGYQKGAVDYLFTPVIPQVLQTKVSVFVELTKKNLQLQQRTQELAALNQDLRVQRLQDLERINNELQVEIIERKQAERRAHELAIRDPLTGLLNRRSLIEHLEHAVLYAARHKANFALLFLDLDKFKNINDTMGHEVGDELLRQVAARLTQAVRESDMVARLGGDEFVILLEGLATENDASTAAKKIAQAIAIPFEIGAYCINTSASIGIGLYPQDGVSVRILMRNADFAMYHAKQQKRGSIQFFHEELNSRLAERSQFEHELQEAIEKKQFELHYQQKVDLQTARITGVEALLYWRHPRFGLIAAPQFVAAATDSGMLGPISDWTLLAACEQGRRWLDSGSLPPGLPIAVNLLTPQVNQNLTETVSNALRQHRLPPACLQLEMCEALLMRETEKVSIVLRELNAAGVTIAIDGFGIGHSSLAALKALPLDVLKIDRAFVQVLGNDESETAMCGAIIDMAHALTLQVVADGVETELQAAILKSLGCDQAQGDFFGKPLTADAMTAKLPDEGRAPPSIKLAIKKT